MTKEVKETRTIKHCHCGPPCLCEERTGRRRRESISGSWIKFRM